MNEELKKHLKEMEGRLKHMWRYLWPERKTKRTWDFRKKDGGWKFLVWPYFCPKSIESLQGVEGMDPPLSKNSKSLLWT